MTTGALAVLESLPAGPEQAREWPGVADPDVLREQIADWLSGYANPGTRRTYAYGLGLPVAWADPRPAREPVRTPPPAPRGPLHDLAWFRWCAGRGLDPRAAGAREVKAWLHALDAAGARPRTRRRMLSTVSALYGHLAEAGVVTANPAALDRSRLGLAASARDASPTVRLTAAQLAALLDSAAKLRTTPLLARRAVAVVALFTLGLRVSELAALTRDDLRRTGGEDVLRVLGKGGVHREVYLTDLARSALEAYLAERDRHGGDAVPAPRGRTRAGSSPLVATREGGPCARADLWALLRRVARAAGPELDGVRDRVHPHALRHAYVTIALEQDAAIQHVQADVGHASIATTQHYDRGLRTRATTAADRVAAAIAATRPTGTEPATASSAPPP
ncbi:MAG: tyrosine-type recombinase/integrase [Pseudonocardiales bacterium]|nr:tyrosine-type recombinase/integrase [Pseudonocardiales bacterium]